MTLKTVHFDIAHALVDYLSRDGDTYSFAWGELTTKDIKTKICNIKDRKWRVNLGNLNSYLSENETDNLLGSANKKLIRLRWLLKESSK